MRNNKPLKITSRVRSRKARLQKIGESLPEVEVAPAGIEHLAFKVGNKTFAYYQFDHHGDGLVSLVCKAPPGRQQSVLEDDPEAYFKPAYVGSKGWVGLRLDMDEVDWDEIKDLLTDAYRLTAPKRLLGE